MFHCLLSKSGALGTHPQDLEPGRAVLTRCFDVHESDSAATRRNRDGVRFTLQQRLSRTIRAQEKDSRIPGKPGPGLSRIGSDGHEALSRGEVLVELIPWRCHLV